MSRSAALTWVSILFVASVLVRIPFLRRPLDGQHDWLTLHTLLTLSIWNETGLRASHFALIMTWPNPADRFISYFEGATVEDANGNTYFIAFPPFAFLLAFSVFKLLHLPPSAVGLKCINLVLLLPASLCFYFLLEQLFPKDRVHLGRWVSVLGTSLFLFDRSILLSLGNLYFPLILIVPLWIISVAVYCTVQDNERPSPASLGGFFALLFVMCYCDWLGFVAAATFILDTIFRNVSSRARIIWLPAVSMSAPLAASTLMVYQYSSIAGMRSFLRALAFRFVDRAGMTTHSTAGYTFWSRHTYDRIVMLYNEQHAGLLLMIWGLGCVWMLTRRRLAFPAWSGRGGRLILLFGLPVITDHLLLLNHTAIHNYANMKAAPLLTVISVLLVAGAMSCAGSNTMDSESTTVRKNSLIARVSVITVVVCLISTGTYLEIRNNLDPSLSKLGAAIHSLAKPNQVVFLVKRSAGDFVSPNLIYFSGRNILMIGDDREAEAFLAKHNEPRGVIFRSTVGGDVMSTYEIFKAEQ